MSPPLLSVGLRFEQDLVLARQRAKQIAELMGFARQEQTEIATAVSEIARNAFKYAGGGTVEFSIELAPRAELVVRVKDQGPGIAELRKVLNGTYVSATGMGAGISGSRRLMSRFEIDSRPGEGTTVVMARVLPPSTPQPGPGDIARIAQELARTTAGSPFEVIQQQNQELVRLLAEVEQQNAQLARLNGELEETNRGVVALYAELDEKAEALKRASDLKSRFLSNVSHEFRTPLNSILSLSRLLHERVDGPLTEEQDRQVTFIRKSAEAVTELINDLLDLAKIEAGKTQVRPRPFSCEELFSTLRGMLRPLRTDDAVALVFESQPGLPTFYTDEGKLSQIMRNLISNALKFTERGEVKVVARRGPSGNAVLSVSDTGIGIAPENHEHIFEEFTQVEGPLHKRTKGTGLGLSLSRKLARLLGGDITVQSELGKGSTFHVTVPGLWPGVQDAPTEVQIAWKLDPDARPVILVGDEPARLEPFERRLRSVGIQVLSARIPESRALIAGVRPVALVLEVGTGSEEPWDFLSGLKQESSLHHLPVLVVGTPDAQNQAVAMGAEFCPLTSEPGVLVERIRALAGVTPSQQRALIIDDDEVSRYLLRRALEETTYQVLEASGGREGLLYARTEHPQIIFLDLRMPEMTGMQVLAELKADPTTRAIPVVVHTSKPLGPDEMQRLSADTVAVLMKEATTRDVAAARVRDVLGRAGLPQGKEHPRA